MPSVVLHIYVDVNMSGPSYTESHSTGGGGGPLLLTAGLVGPTFAPVLAKSSLDAFLYSHETVNIHETGSNSSRWGGSGGKGEIQWNSHIHTDIYAYIYIYVYVYIYISQEGIPTEHSCVNMCCVFPSPVYLPCPSLVVLFQATTALPVFGPWLGVSLGGVLECWVVSGLVHAG